MNQVVETMEHGLKTCGYAPEDTFVCPRCDNTFCYCDGSNDDTPGLCTNCANELYVLWEQTG